MGKVSLVLQKATTNYISNPSGEIGVASWAVNNGAATQNSSESKFGSYALKITGNAVGPVNISVTPVTSETNQARGATYTGSVWVLGDTVTTVGTTLTFRVGESGGAAATAYDTTTTVLTGEWQRVSISHTIVEPDRTNVVINFYLSGGIGTVFWADGCQLEESANLTTYCDGDQEGCEWSGVHHASISTRSAQSRAGGRLIDLDDYNISVDNLFGFEMPPLFHNVHDQPLQPGAFLQSIKTLPRIIQMPCHTDTTTECNMYLARQQLIDALKHDAVATLQPVILRYTATEDCTDEDAVDCPPYHLYFNSADEDVVISDNAVIQDLPPTAAGSRFAAEAWIRADGWGESNTGRIFDKTDSAAQGWYFGIDSTFGLICVFYSDAVNGMAQSGLDDFTPDGEWHHVAATMDTSNNPELWIDGVQILSYLVSQPMTGNYVSDVGNDLYIGNALNNARTFDGDIGWCRISHPGVRYTGASYTIPPRCILPIIDANTVGQWGMVEGEGTTLDNMEGTAAIDGTIDNEDMWRLDGCSCDVAGVPVEISCYYDSGLEGQFDITCYDTFILRLISYDPLWSQIGESSTLMAISQSLANTRYVIAKVNGEWTHLGPPSAGSAVYAIADDAQYVYVGGNFTNWDGIAAADNIVRWEKATGTWTALAAGLSNTVYGLDIGPDGTLYIVGTFLNAGGVANADYICQWNGTAYAALGNPNTGTANFTDVRAVVVGPAGFVWVGGDFLNLADIANADMAAYWDGAAWNAVAAGCNLAIRAVAAAADGTVYYGGVFTNWGDADGDRIVSFTIAGGLVSLDTGLTSTVRAIKVDSAGLVYLGGNFNIIGGDPGDFVLSWDGNAFIQLGTGMDSDVWGLAIAPNNYVYAVGDFTTAGGLASDAMARWNGYTWTPLEVDLPGAWILNAVHITDQDPVVANNFDVYIGTNATGTTVTGEVTTVTPAGSAEAFPRFTINRTGGTSATLQLIRNETTGDELLLDIDILDGETITVDLRAGQKTVTSDWRGNLATSLLPNSDFATFRLLPGANLISAYVLEVGGPTTTAFVVWKDQYHSVSGAA